MVASSQSTNAKRTRAKCTQALRFTPAPQCGNISSAVALKERLEPNIWWLLGTRRQQLTKTKKNSGSSEVKYYVLVDKVNCVFLAPIHECKRVYQTRKNTMFKAFATGSTDPQVFSHGHDEGLKDCSLVCSCPWLFASTRLDLSRD